MTNYERLLRQWCEKLLALQITFVNEMGIKGGIMCPACARIHGRCFDAIYPFMYLADKDGDKRYLEGAKMLFDWAENMTSREDGSFVNDTNSEWKGTTVFTVIQLVEALKYHGHILDAETYAKWKNRIAKAADFLYSFEQLNQNNVNYKITNSLAMYYCGEFFANQAYTIKAKELAYTATEHISEKGILFGEGRPIKGYSPRGCRPVDIGYNLEESLPSLALYAHITGDKEIQDYVEKAFSYQVKFMLEDGGIDNSFGTRNFKWTYWGSRTSDGCTMGYLLLADKNPIFGVAAQKNLSLLEKCTQNGLLHGGPHYSSIGEYACVHHTFAHAKVLAAILDHGLEKNSYEGELPRKQLRGIEYFPDIDTYLVGGSEYTVTVTGYDWEYMKGGHASGGTLSMLEHSKVGAVLCASMSEYSLKEPNNMQLPRFKNHECLTPRIEYKDENQTYSNVYDYKSKISYEEFEDKYCIKVRGNLVDIDHTETVVPMGNYEIKYIFTENGICSEVRLYDKASYILPIISEKAEAVTMIKKGIIIHKKDIDIILTVDKGEILLPYGEDRIYHLVPGFAALKVQIVPYEGNVRYKFKFKKSKRLYEGK